MSPVFLLIDEVIEIHIHQLDLYGGSPGIRERGLLESALAQPQAQFGGEFLHPDLHAMAAAYAYHVALNHPFVEATSGSRSRRPRRSCA